MADIAHHLSEEGDIIGILAHFHLLSQLFAEDTAEIFVAGEGGEGAGIRQHANASGDKPGFHELVKLFAYAADMVKKPPCGAVLHLGSVAAEVHRHGAQHGAVAAPVAAAMANGVRCLLHADVAVSVTGLAGPGGDEYGNPVGTVYIGYEDDAKSFVEKFLFEGDREAVRNQTIEMALKIVLENNK